MTVLKDTADNLPFSHQHQTVNILWYNQQFTNKIYILDTDGSFSYLSEEHDWEVCRDGGSERDCVCAAELLTRLY